MSYTETKSWTNTLDWSNCDILWEDFTQRIDTDLDSNIIKKKAVSYIGVQKFRNGLSRKLLRQFTAKTRKIRTSIKKAERAKDHEITRQAQWYLNFHKK
jgi:hypothetical protein